MKLATVVGICSWPIAGLLVIMLVLLTLVDIVEDFFEA